MGNYFLYILHSPSFDRYYIGISQEPKRRLVYHNSIEKGFTSRYRPWIIVYKQDFENKNQQYLQKEK